MKSLWYYSTRSLQKFYAFCNWHRHSLTISFDKLRRLLQKSTLFTQIMLLPMTSSVTWPNTSVKSFTFKTADHIHSFLCYLTNILKVTTSSKSRLLQRQLFGTNVFDPGIKCVETSYNEFLDDGSLPSSPLFKFVYIFQRNIIRWS